MTDRPRPKLRLIKRAPLRQRIAFDSDGYIDIKASRLSPEEVQKIALRQIERDIFLGRNPFADDD